MKEYRKQFFSVLSCLFVISLIYSHFPGAEASCGEGRPEQSPVHHIVQYLKDKQVEMDHKDLRTVAGTIQKESKNNNVDYRLVLALIEVESNYRRDAISPDGSHGLMQLKPATAHAVAQETDIPYNGSSDLLDPRKNIRIGVYFLSKLIDEFKSIRKALYAYNIGPTRAKRQLARLPKNREPKSHFTRRVMQAFQNNVSVLPAF